jgi:hypothetical protein
LAERRERGAEVFGPDGGGIELSEHPVSLIGCDPKLTRLRQLETRELKVVVSR